MINKYFINSKFNFNILTIKFISKFLIIFIGLIVLFSAKLSVGFIDPVHIFHEGELVGNYWNMIDYFNKYDNFPVFIHGAMDYWPSLIAGYIFGDSSIIFGTRIVIVFITLFTWVLFVFLGVDMLSYKNKNNPIIIIFFVAFIMTLPLFDLSVMRIEESPIGLRDVFLCIQLYLLFNFFLDNEKKYIFLFFGFLLLPFCLCWSYDRGLASLVGCISLLFYFVYYKKYFALSISLFALILTISFFELTKFTGSIQDNIKNIIYWSKVSSEVWGTELIFSKELLFSIFPLFLVLTLFVYYIIQIKNRNNKISLGIFLFVFSCEIVLLKSAYNRPSLSRGLMSVWPLILLLLVEFQNVPKFRFYKKSDIKYNNKVEFFLKKLSIILICIVVILFSIPFSKIYVFKKSLFFPPKDINISGENLVRVSREISDNPYSINFVNQGIITLLSKTKHCTKFPYLIYADNKNQSYLIHKIKNSNIRTVIIESNDWSSVIDNRSMKSRLPVFYLYVCNNFKIKKRIKNYVILSKED